MASCMVMPSLRLQTAAIKGFSLEISSDGPVGMVEANLDLPQEAIAENLAYMALPFARNSLRSL